MLYGKFIKRKDNNIDLKKLILIIVVMVFVIRALYVIIIHKKEDVKLYISLLNKGMPYVESLNSTESGEALSVEKLLIETLGINKISPFSLIKSEVPYFENVSYEHIEYDENSIATLNPFQLDDNSIIKYTPEENTGNTVASKAYKPELKKQLDVNKPEILIYHSHTTEYYSPATRDTTEENLSVVGVGNVLTKELEENYGIATIHDKTIHSTSYNDSYKRSGETVQKYLDNYKNFKIIIDIHRDAVPDKSTVTTNINGEDLAKIMFVTAKNNPHYSQNQALTDKINGLSRSLFPGLSKGIKTYERGKDSFNQSKSPTVILIEVGANTNTNQEAQNTAKYIARLLAEALNGN